MKKFKEAKEEKSVREVKRECVNLLCRAISVEVLQTDIISGRKDRMTENELCTGRRNQGVKIRICQCRSRRTYGKGQRHL